MTNTHTRAEPSTIKELLYQSIAEADEIEEGGSFFVKPIIDSQGVFKDYLIRYPIGLRDDLLKYLSSTTALAPLRLHVPDFFYRGTNVSQALLQLTFEGQNNAMPALEIVRKQAGRNLFQYLSVDATTGDNLPPDQVFQNRLKLLQKLGASKDKDIENIIEKVIYIGLQEHSPSIPDFNDGMLMVDDNLNLSLVDIVGGEYIDRMGKSHMSHDELRLLVHQENQPERRSMKPQALLARAILTAFGMNHKQIEKKLQKEADSADSQIERLQSPIRKAAYYYSSFRYEVIVKHLFGEVPQNVRIQMAEELLSIYLKIAPDSLKAEIQQGFDTVKSKYFEYEDLSNWNSDVFYKIEKALPDNAPLRNMYHTTEFAQEDVARRRVQKKCEHIIDAISSKEGPAETVRYLESKHPEWKGFQRLKKVEGENVGLPEPLEWEPATSRTLKEYRSGAVRASSVEVAALEDPPQALKLALDRLYAAAVPQRT